MKKIFSISGVCFGLVLLPFIQSANLFTHSSSVVCGLLLMFSMMVAFAYMPSANRLAVNAIDIDILLLLIVCSVGKYDTYDPLLILQNIGLFFIYIGFRSLKTNDVIFVILSAVIAACFLQSVYGILQYYGWLTPNHPLQFLTGSFRNQNIFAAYICFGPVICFGMFLFVDTILINRYTVVWKILLVCLTAWFISIIILTGTRAVWAGTVAAATFLLYFRYSEQIKTWRKISKLFIIGTIFTLFCIGILFLHFNFKKDSSAGRLFIWKVTLQMITQKPIAGQGAGSFRANYPYAQAEYLANNPFSEGNRLADNITNPFNEYLNLIYEHGLLGLIIMTVLFIFMLNIENTPSVGILKSCLIALAVISFFSYPFQIFAIKLTGIMIAALLCNLSIYKAFITIKTRTFIPCVCFLVFFTAFYGYNIRNCKIATEAHNIDVSNKLDVFRDSYNQLKNNHEYLNLYVKLLLRQEDKSSMEQLKRLTKIAPNTQVMCDMGDMYKQEENYELAENHYLLAHHMVPAKFVPLHKLLILYVETGQSEKARNLAKKISEKPVKVKTNITDRIKKEAEKILASPVERQ